MGHACVNGARKRISNIRAVFYSLSLNSSGLAWFSDPHSPDHPHQAHQQPHHKERDDRDDNILEQAETRRPVKSKEENEDKPHHNCQEGHDDWCEWHAPSPIEWRLPFLRVFLILHAGAFSSEDYLELIRKARLASRLGVRLALVAIE
jgi:hypothetical protein